MEKEILAILLLTLVVSGCASQDNSQKSDVEKGTEAVSQATQSDKYTVKYTKNGFSPKQVIIRQGDTVRWVNRAPDNLLITSSYKKECPEERAEFGSCKKVEEYEKVFKKPGKYRYHNKFSRHHRAVVIVNGNPAY